MTGIKRAVVITPDQDAFLDTYAARTRSNRSVVVRQAIDLLMKEAQKEDDPSVLLPSIPTESRINTYYEVGA